MKSWNNHYECETIIAEARQGGPLNTEQHDLIFPSNLRDCIIIAIIAILDSVNPRDTVVAADKL